MVWDIIYKHSPWLVGRREELPEFRRDVIFDICEHLRRREVFILYGPRQTGKTVALKQYAQESNIPVIYILADDPEIRNYPQIFQKIFEAVSDEYEEARIIIDEAHKFPNWADYVKTIFDLGINRGIAISGSSAYELIIGSSESLVGRCFLRLLLPLSLRECLRALNVDLYGVSRKLFNAFMDAVKSSDLSILKHELLRSEKVLYKHSNRINWLVNFISTYGGFPEIFFNREKKHQELYRLLITYTWLSIYKDAMRIAGARVPDKLEDLFFLISYYAGSEQSFYSLSKNLGIRVPTVEQYVEALKHAFLIVESRQYRKSPTKTVRGKRKYYPIDPGLRNSMLKLSKESIHEQIGYINELLVLQHSLRLLHRIEGDPLPRTYYWSSENAEVDIILKLAGRIIGIESKTNDLRKARRNFARMTLEEEEPDVKLVVWRRKEIREESDLLAIPLHYFLLIQP
ncbi:MAG: ATP-binding protein [Candidatus Njordarchaeales archaeon]